MREAAVYAGHLVDILLPMIPAEGAWGSEPESDFTPSVAQNIRLAYRASLDALAACEYALEVDERQRLSEVEVAWNSSVYAIERLGNAIKEHACLNGSDWVVMSLANALQAAEDLIQHLDPEEF